MKEIAVAAFNATGTVLSTLIVSATIATLFGIRIKTTKFSIGYGC